MRKLLSMIALVAGLAGTSATAQVGAVERGDVLQFVAETAVPVPDGTGTLSLCHLVDTARVFGVPVFTRLQGYALSREGCTGAAFREITPAQVQQLQTSRLIAPDVPSEPKMGLATIILGNAGLVALAAALLVRVLMMFTKKGARREKSPDALAVHSLVAMSQVAIADGRLDDSEVHQISQILTRLTGRGYSPEQVMEMLERLNPSADDLAQVGQDLSEKDRQIVLEAALNIAVADGDIHPNEYAVVSELAERMRIGADQFRSALSRISAHLQTVQVS